MKIGNLKEFSRFHETQTSSKHAISAVTRAAFVTGHTFGNIGQEEGRRWMPERRGQSEEEDAFGNTRGRKTGLEGGGFKEGEGRGRRIEEGEGRGWRNKDEDTLDGNQGHGNQGHGNQGRKNKDEDTLDVLRVDECCAGQPLYHYQLQHHTPRAMATATTTPIAKATATAMAIAT